MTQEDKPVEIFVPLLDEAIPTIRPTKAIQIQDDLYKVLAADDLNPEDEVWEFLPGSIVRCDLVKSCRTGKMILRANAIQNEDGSFTLSRELPTEE